jgi:hypothetical protein
MMRDHGSQELFIGNRTLLAYEKEKCESGQNAGCNDQPVPLLILIYGSRHKTSIKIIGAVINPAM